LVNVESKNSKSIGSNIFFDIKARNDDCLGEEEEEHTC
jgi:hypothetical protein